MRYLLAIVFPPIAVLLCGKPIQFLFNIVLTMLFWIPGMIHALLVVSSHLADRRTARLERAIRETVVR
ncbi:MAG TPA: YqaE/Pmp3 family membrane protein [bacterium]|nr:YqaE/Pmp3 family membrane protein [bacterium]